MTDYIRQYFLLTVLCGALAGGLAYRTWYHLGSGNFEKTSITLASAAHDHR